MGSIPNMLYLLLLTGLLSTGVAHAQVYKHVDEQGNVTFTDQPPPDSEKVEVSRPNTAAPPTRSAYPPEKKPAAKAQGPDYTVNITSPANETIIPRGPGNFSVSASVAPPLTSGHKLQLLMDGSPREEPRASGNWSLTNVYRGEHSIQVAVVDARGKQLTTSDAIKVYVFRPSSNF